MIPDNFLKETAYIILASLIVGAIGAGIGFVFMALGWITP